MENDEFDDECDDNFNDDDVDLGQKCDKEPLSRTTRDEKGQMRFHFLPHFALNCDLHYDVDDCDDDHEDDHYDEIGDDNIEKGQMSRNKKMTKSLVKAQIVTHAGTKFTFQMFRSLLYSDECILCDHMNLISILTLSKMLLLDSTKNCPILSDENKWREMKE